MDPLAFSRCGIPSLSLSLRLRLAPINWILFAALRDPIGVGSHSKPASPLRGLGFFLWSARLSLRLRLAPIKKARA
jgi:hypothetical protein